MAAGKDESRAGGGSKSRSSSEALLVQVDLLVPLAPDLGGSEHASRAALVTEGSLTSTVSTTTRDTRDTGDGTSCMSLYQQLPSFSVAHAFHIPVPQDSAEVW